MSQIKKKGMNALNSDINKVVTLLEYQSDIYKNSEVPVTQEVLNKFHITERDFTVALRNLLLKEPTLKKTYEHVDGDVPTGPENEIEFFKIKLPEDFKKLIVKKYVSYSSGLPSEYVHLVSSGINFNKKEGTIEFNGTKCELPPFKNEFDFCDYMFTKETNVAIPWDELSTHISGKGFDQLNKKDAKSIQDTMYRINNRIKKTFFTQDDLFSWESKTVIRNF